MRTAADFDQPDAGRAGSVVVARYSAGGSAN